MEIYKLRLSYAVYTKKRNGILWNCYWRRLILMVTAYSIIRKNRKIVKKNSDGRRQVHLPRRLRVEKERSKHNSNLTIRIMIKNSLLFLWNASWMLLEQTWIIWVISHDELNFRLPCVWQNTLAFKNFCSNYLILLYGFRMHFLRAQSIAF